jgi:putative flippase GtrA
LIGFFTWITDFLIFTYFVDAGVSIHYSNFISGTVGIILNFNLYFFYVFNRQGNYFRASIRFFISFLFERTINTAQLYLWLHFGFPPVYAKLAATVVQAPLSYYLSRRIIYFDRSTPRILPESKSDV